MHVSIHMFTHASIGTRDFMASLLVSRPGPANLFLHLDRLGYPHLVDCRQPHEIDIDTFQAVLKRANALPVDNLHLHLFPRLAPQDPQMSTYIRWFARPTKAQRAHLHYLALR
jgi:hypothetical protein